MSQKPQSSSNETNFSFAPGAPAPIIDTPGSAESGGGGTTSYLMPGSGASSNSFAMVSNASSHRGSARRSTSARSNRTGRSPRAKTDDRQTDEVSKSATLSKGDVSKSATSSKRKSSGSAARNESEARLRRQLQHVNDKLERSEQARTELENRVIDCIKTPSLIVSHRDQLVSNV